MEFNKIGTKRTMVVLNICHRPVYMEELTLGAELTTYIFVVLEFASFHLFG